MITLRRAEKSPISKVHYHHRQLTEEERATPSDWAMAPISCGWLKKVEEEFFCGEYTKPRGGETKTTPLLFNDTERQIREGKQTGFVINNVFVSDGFRIRREVDVRGPSGCVDYCQRPQRKSREHGNVRGGQINPVLSVPCRRKHAFLWNSRSSKDLGRQPSCLN